MPVASPTITLRPTVPADDGFLRRVYAATRAAEMAIVPWDDDQKEAFLRQQFDAQDFHYRAHYRPARFDVIEVDDRPVGRLYVARWEHEIRIIDIAILPEHRGAGTGTFLLRGLLDEAARENKKVSIHVEKVNPAMRLYERLGFTQVEDKGHDILMEVAP